ncbi:MAG TPA: SOS response-associated peptidase [Acidobacteriaceae bacterium]|jgi:putative SOS response-associated peptidase YedK|nr:SOS response-associated peptidase [Acidobacteriaceae bacterium]
MCGRYFRRSDKQRLAEAFRTGLPTTFEILPSYNVAPQSFQPIVRLNEESAERELALLRWGLIPFWAKDAKVAYSTINAKSETVATSAMFREALKRRRCLVPAEGFYEWQKQDAKTKQPWALGLSDGGPFAFAGLWERWKDKTTQQPLETYTILTTESNELTATIHNRMPVILTPRDYDRWLVPDDPARLPVDLLRPCPAEEMTMWKVGSAVGNVRNNDATLCNPT